MIAHFVILERIKCGNQGKERKHREEKKKNGLWAPHWSSAIIKHCPIRKLMLRRLQRNQQRLLSELEGSCMHLHNATAFLACWRVCHTCQPCFPSHFILASDLARRGLYIFSVLNSIPKVSIILN